MNIRPIITTLAFLLIATFLPTLDAQAHICDFSPNRNASESTQVPAEHPHPNGPGDHCSEVGPPTGSLNPVASLITSSSATITWSQPGNLVDPYKYEYAHVGFSGWMNTGVSPSNPNRSITLSSLTGGTYTYNFRACNIELSSPPSCTSPESVQFTIDAAPIANSIELGHQGNGAISFLWDDSGNAANGYVPEVRSRPANTDGSQAGTWGNYAAVCTDLYEDQPGTIGIVTTDRCTQTGFDLNRIYQAQVVAYTSSGTQVATSSVALVMNYPGTPGQASASPSSSSTGSVALNWSAPTGGGSGPVARYKVEGRRVDVGSSFTGAFAPIQCGSNVDGVVPTNTCATNALADGDWQFRVQAQNGPVDAPQISSYSNVPGGQQLRVARPPTPVASLSASQGAGANENTLTLTWAHVGGSVDSYQVAYFSDPAQAPVIGWNTIDGPFSGTLTTTFQAQNGETHYFKVRSCSVIACTTPANDSINVSFATPSPASNLSRSTSINTLNQVFTWDSSSPVADEYSVTLTSTDGGPTIGPVVVQNKTWPVTVSGNGTYELSVEVCNDTPLASDPCSTPSTAQFAVNTSGVSVDFIEVGHQGAGALSFTWDDSANAQYGYIPEVQSRPANADGSPNGGWSAYQAVCTHLYEDGHQNVIGITSTNACTETGFAVNRIYRAQVTALAPGASDVAVSDSELVMNYPNTPGQASASPSSSSTGSVALSWSAPTGGGSGPVARYKVEGRRVDVGSSFTGAFAPIQCGSNVDGVVPTNTCATNALADGDWQFRVQAQNGPVDAPQISSYSALPGGKQLRVLRPPAAPGSPSIFIPLSDIPADGSHSQGGFSINWTAPVGSALVDGYEVTELFHQVSGGTFTPSGNVFPVTDTTLSFQSNPRATGYYKYEIRAYNELNDAPGNPAAVTEEIKVVNDFGEPASVVTSGSGININGEFTVSWTAPVGAVPSSYELQTCQSESASSACLASPSFADLTTTTNNQAISPALLAGDGFYRFRVRAYYEGNWSGYSAYSAGIEIQYPPEWVSSPVATQRVEDEDIIDVSWSAASGTVAHYRIQPLLSAGATPDSEGWLNLPSDTLSQSFGVTTNGNHYYAIQACNASCSAVAEAVAAVAFTEPSTPVLVRVSDDETVSQEFSWNVDDSTDYQLLEISQTDGEWSQGPFEVDRDSSWVIDVPGSGAYQFSVTACNSIPDGSLCGSPGQLSFTVSIENSWSAKGGTVPDAPYSPISATTHDQTVGALAGSGGANGGNAYYNIPIEAPPGRNGMAPQVRLSYSSRGSNGPLGVGFSLSANQSIVRCAATVVHDGVNRAVQYDLAYDRLCLNGDRLLLENGVGTYGTSSTTYRTESDGLTKVLQVGGNINSPNVQFVVRYANGRTASFGATPDSKHVADGQDKIMTWGVSQENDASGNAIHYTYDEFGKGEHLLTQIAYTGYMNNAGNRLIHFNYEDRVSSDIHNSFSAGGLTQRTRRLANIETDYAGSLVKRYKFGYNAGSQYSGRTLLRSAQECGFDDGGEICRPASLFNWSESQVQYEFEQLTYSQDGAETPIGADIVRMHKAIPHSDENGDGVVDFLDVFTNAEGEYTGDRSGQQLETCFRPRGSFDVTCLTGDFNNDGLTDTFVKNGNSIRIIYNQSQEIGAPTVPSPINTSVPWDGEYGQPLAVQDLNGDGWTDFAIREETGDENGYDLVLYLHSGQVTNVSGTSVDPYIGGRKQIKSYIYNPHDDGSEIKSSFSFLGDMDGNGSVDIVEYVNNRLPNVNRSQRDTPQNILFVEPLANGTVTIDERNFQSYVVDWGMPAAGVDYWENSSLFTDINADGLPDWLTTYNRYDGRLSVRLNTGSGFLPDWINLPISLPMTNREIPNGPDPFEVAFVHSPIMSKTVMADYNSDGRTDMLLATTVVADGCASFHTFPNGQSSSVYVEECNNDLYLSYNEAAFSQVNSTIDGQYHDVSLRRYSAYIFGSDTDGNITANLVGTDIYAAANQRVAVDAFGDGLTDILTAVGCHPTDGACSLTDRAGSSPTDIVFDGPTQTGIYISRNKGAAREGERYRAPDLLESVVDGVGVEYRWEYKPLSSDAYNVTNEGGLAEFYAPDHAYLNSGDMTTDGSHYHFGSSLYVVAEHSYSHGGTEDQSGDGTYGDLPSEDDAFNAYRYRYGGAVFNNKGRGFLGFRSITVDELSRGVKTKTVFDQIWPRTNRVVKTCTLLVEESENITVIDDPTQSDSVISCEQDAIVDVTSYYDVHQITGASLVALPREEITVTRDLWDRSILINTTTKSNVFYPGYANLDTQTVTSTDTGAGSYSSLSKNVYYPVDTTSWWLDKKQRLSVMRNAVAGRPALPVIPDLATLDPASQSTTTIYQWDDTHRKQSTVVLAGGSTTINKYTDYGLTDEVRVSVTSDTADDRVTRTTYSSDGYFSNVITNHEGHVSSVVTDPAFGVETQITDANSQVTIQQFDAFGQMTTINAPGAPPVYAALSWCDSSCTPSALYQSTTQQAGKPTSVEQFDMHGRLVKAWREGYGDSQLVAENIIQLTNYDRNGDLRFSSVPYHASWPLAHIGLRNHDFDPLGRLMHKSVNQATAGQFHTYYNYSGLVTDITAGVLSLSRTVDSAGRLIETRDAMSNYTRFAYDGSSNTILVQDANGNNIVAKYDALGRKLYVNDPNAGRTDYDYNKLGETVYEKDASGNEVWHQYDGLGRQTARFVNSGGLIGIPNALWVYDQYNGQDIKGALLHESSDSGMSKTYTVDVLGRVVQTDYALDASHQYSIQKDYDSNYGRLKSMAYPTGLTVGVGYNDKGFAFKEFNAASNYVYRTVDALDARDNPVNLSLNAGGLLEQVNYYDNTGQMESLRVHRENELVHYIGYENYDLYGNVKEQRTSYEDQTATENFIYDPLHRLAKSTRTFSASVSGDLVVNPPPIGIPGSIPRGGSNSPPRETTRVVDYSYDAVGNLLSKSDYADTYLYGGSSAACANDAGPNAVSSVIKRTGTVEFCYDERGNMLVGDGYNVAYNNFNHATLITGFGVAMQFSYGADKQRYRQIRTGGSGNRTTWYLDKLVEINETGSKTEYRQYLGDYGLLTETVQDGNSSSALTFFHKDRLGSVATITEVNDEIVERRSFDPFGKPRDGDWKDLPTPILDSDVTDRGFTAHEHLDDVQLIHMNGRIYDYNLGRFLNVDPYIISVGNSQAINPYSYILNNPLAGVDPSGYFAFLIPVVIFAIEAYNVYDAVNTIVDAAETLSDPNASGSSKVGAVVDAVLTVVDPTPGNVLKRGGDQAARRIADAKPGGTPSGNNIRGDSAKTPDSAANNSSAVQSNSSAGGASQSKSSQGDNGSSRSNSSGDSASEPPSGNQKKNYGGGSHNDMKKPTGDGLDSHHMPDKNADPSVSEGKGPAIRMDVKDHKQTDSWGGGADAKAFRDETKQMIADGKGRDAMAREIKSVRNAADKASGDRTKYNPAVREMLEYAKESSDLLDK